MNRLSECRVQISRFVTRVKIQLSEFATQPGFDFAELICYVAVTAGLPMS